ncbi:MAG: DMT family transporter [Parabacteroides sp.]|nr:DMT family transporter [Parabacteroides sp.]
MREAFIKLHLSILLAGFTGILGKLISLSEGVLVWYRMFLTSLILLLILWIGKKLRKVSFRDFLKMAGVGLLLALHWLFFFGSIKASNVSIGVVCFSVTGFFSAIFEPLFGRRKISFRELLYSVVAVLGILLIFQFDMRYRYGIMLGVVSSALAALYTISNKKVGSLAPSSSILLYEMIGGVTFLSCLLPFYLYFSPQEYLIPNAPDFIYLLLFAIFCTICMNILQIQALKSISAFTMNLSYNLEPVYSIILAMIIFGEAKDLNLAFYAGLSLIVFSVFLQMGSVMKQRKVK